MRFKSFSAFPFFNPIKNPVPDELAQRELREELLLMQLVQEARQPLLKHEPFSNHPP